MDSTEVLVSSTLLNPVPEPIAPSLPLKVPSTCPWSKVAVAETVSFSDVMSEQLAKSLQQDDETCNVPQNMYVTLIKLLVVLKILNFFS